MAPSPKTLIDISEVPSQSLLLRAEEAQLSRSFLRREMLQSLDQFCSALLDPLHELDVSGTEEPRIGDVPHKGVLGGHHSWAQACTRVRAGKTTLNSEGMWLFTKVVGAPLRKPQ